MINSIHGKNFQSWKDITLDLDPGVNAIVGPSDCGKTVAFRLLNWIFNNRPGGNEFHSWAGGDPYGAVDLGNDGIVTRSRRANENIYTLNDQEFKAFGTNVPEPIQKALNISDINFQFQLDDPFLFGETPGNIARKLNEVVDLAVIDKALFNINQRYRKESNQLANAEIKKEELSKELEEYSWLSDAENRLMGLEQLNKLVISNKQQALALDIIIKEIYHVEIEIDQTYIGPIKADDEVRELIELGHQITEKMQDTEDLDNLISEIEGLEEEISQSKGYLQFESAVKEACDLNLDIGMRWIDRNNFMRFLDDIKTTGQYLDSKREELEELEKEFNEIMPSQCPLCDQEMK
jgi:exonuclease SbcC